ncbi:MAG: bifunctional pyr operon transcriptional regulator/uracil phosphoribosyltransferase PyrR [Tissierellia bacterium]|nr:bifunctional pyr operon transcriptional regulator/uracil phosphoribosyltransferase PyrR [Tissierellia bacterium]
MRRLMDEKSVARSLARISHEIIERNKGVENIVLLGILTRGGSLSRIIADNLERFEGIRVPVGTLDITPFRDDRRQEERTEDISEIPVSLQGKDVIVVDDVLHTGRTLRAALEAVFSRGRASTIQVAVLVDRGHRELPIRADYVGKNIPSSHTEEVMVKVMDVDGESGVYIARSS